MIKLTFCLPKDKIGMVIGKSGKTFQDMSKESGARMHLQHHLDMPFGSQERAMILLGSKANILAAIELVSEKIRRDSPANTEISSDKNAMIKWIIPQSMCGVLIGKNGEVVRAINESSGAWVKIAHTEESCAGMNERIVYIRGNPQATHAALNQVKRLVGGRPFLASDDQSSATTAVSRDTVDTKTIPLPILQSVLPIAESHGVRVEIDPNFDVVFKDSLSICLTGGSDVDRLSAAEAIDNLVDSWKQIALTIASLSADENSTTENLCVKMLLRSEWSDRAANTVDAEGKNLLQRIREHSGVQVIRQAAHNTVSNEVDLAAWIFVGPKPAVLAAVGKAATDVDQLYPEALPHLSLQLTHNANATSNMPATVLHQTYAHSMAQQAQAQAQGQGQAGHHMHMQHQQQQAGRIPYPAYQQQRQFGGGGGGGSHHLVHHSPYGSAPPPPPPGYANPMSMFSGGMYQAPQFAHGAGSDYSAGESSYFSQQHHLQNFGGGIGGSGGNGAGAGGGYQYPHSQQSTSSNPCGSSLDAFNHQSFRAQNIQQFSQQDYQGSYEAAFSYLNEVSNQPNSNSSKSGSFQQQGFR